MRWKLLIRALANPSDLPWLSWNDICPACKEMNVALNSTRVWPSCVVAKRPVKCIHDNQHSERSRWKTVDIVCPFCDLEL